MLTHIHSVCGTPLPHFLGYINLFCRSALEPSSSAGEWLRGGGPVGARCLGARWRTGDVERWIFGVKKLVKIGDESDELGKNRGLKDQECFNQLDEFLTLAVCLEALMHGQKGSQDVF